MSAPRMAGFAVVKCALVREDSLALGPIASPADAPAILRQLIEDDGREHFWVVGLNVRHRPTLACEISVGCLSSSLVHPREVFRPLVLGSCAAVILAHNHPSGDPEPSAEDVALTRRLASAGTLMGIDVLDHVILGSGSDRYVSLRDRGVL